MPKNFALIGVAGYIAPRHLQAIKESDGSLVAALDPHDSVGILDSFFPKTHFFTEFERFDRHIEQLRRENNSHAVNYVSICSPNYLHDAHIRFALRVGADAICEKPLVLNPWTIDGLKEIEKESGKKVYTILQLRVHPGLVALKEKLDKENSSTKKDITLSYITSRGSWYLYSWKGDNKKSGGVATNIGIHFFDLLIWLFGKVQNIELHLNQENKMAGFIELERARVRWFLSVDKNDLPDGITKIGQPTYRSLTIDDDEVEFSKGFTDLHTVLYKDILQGKGFGLDDAYPSIKLVHDIRNSPVSEKSDNIHQFVRQ